MSNTNNPTTTPLMMKFAAKAPILEDHPFHFFDKIKKIWLDQKGLPAFEARASRPYTSAMTDARYIKPGWTPSGKYRQGKSMPAKMDKRAGK